MSVKDIFSKRAAFSFEVFPPKTDVIYLVDPAEGI